MQVEFLYYPDCPSYERTLELLQQVLAEEGVTDPVQIFCIETEEQAQEHRFIGSPTIRIDGKDIDPRIAPDTPPRLTCRLYIHEDGRPSPLPSIEMMRAAVRQARTERRQGDKETKRQGEEKTTGRQDEKRQTTNVKR